MMERDYKMIKIGSGNFIVNGLDKSVKEEERKEYTNVMEKREF